MDHLTADSDIVLASMGGKPQMPEDRIEEVSSDGSETVGQPGSNAASEEKLSTAERGEGLRERNLGQRPSETL